MLMLLATALAVASCRDPLVGEGDPDSLALAAVQQQTGLRLTYLCGNRFRIRTTRRDTVRVRWDVYRTADTGSVVVPGVEAPATQRDVEFETRERGTTRIFLGAQLVDTKANGGTTCSALSVVPENHVMAPDESLRVVVDSTTDPRRSYFRRYAHVMFRPGTSGASIAQVLDRYGAVIARGTVSRLSYTIILPDLGPSIVDWKARLVSLRLEPTIEFVFPFENGLPPISQSGRFPADGDLPRSEWLGTATDRSWALRAIRANTAWSCEAGVYEASGSSGSSVAIIERVTSENADYEASFVGDMSPRMTNPNVGLGQPLLEFSRKHAQAVTGLVSSTGDNGRGIAGVMWKTILRSAGILSREGALVTPLAFFDQTLPALVTAGVRVINFSTHWLETSDPELWDQNYELWRRAFASYPNVLFVASAGNRGTPFAGYSTTPTMQQVMQSQAYLLSFFARAKADGARNVIIVGGASKTGGKAPGSEWILSSAGGGLGIDVAAPSVDVFTLADPQSGKGTGTWTGTSFAAPLVSGAAVAALAIDPSLSARDLRDLIVASARDSIVDDFGRLQAKQPVHDGVYMLDVYNLLRRVAARRPGLPICGAPVRTDAIAQQVIIGEGPAEVRVTVPGLNGFSQLGTTLSVAPGGRRIAVNVFTDDFQLRPRELVLENGQWTLGPVRRDATAIAYADGDTVLFLTDPAAPWVVERRGRRPATRPLLDDFRRPVPDDVRQTGSMGSQSVDPSGRFVVSSVSCRNPDLACGAAAAGQVVAITHLDSDARDVVRDERFDPCVPRDPFPLEGGAIAWSATGERGWFFARNIAAGGT